jgi:hypothetical protein
MKAAAYCATVLFAFTVMSHAQIQTIVLEKPVKASRLAGVVIDPSGAVIPHATVELIDCPVDRPHREIRDAMHTTETDEKGEFSLIPSGLTKPYCLHISALGFDPLEFQVRLIPLAGKMRLKMHIAT